MSNATVIDISTRLMESLADRTITAPAPGLYPNVPMDVYHRWAAASNSRLSRLHRSPAHLKAYLDEPPKDTAAQIIGRAVHSAILEPDDFTKRYVAGPEGDRRTKAVKDAWEAAEREYGVGFVLRPSEYTCALKTRDAVYAHAAARPMLRHLEATEQSLVWRDKASGVMCKARFDGITREIEGGVIIDIKTTTDARLRAFERSIYTYGYHRQGAFYLDGAAAQGLAVAHYVNIAVEKDPPYAVSVFRLTEGAIDAGRQQLAGLLTTYATCFALNEWPAYPQHVIDAALPAYAWSEIDAETTTFGTNYEATP